MHVIQLHNRKRQGGGDCTAFAYTCALLRAHGQRVTEVTRDSRQIVLNLSGKVRAFFNSIYSRSAARELTELLVRDKADILHVHNLYPLFSSSVLVSARKKGMPVIFHCHNYRLTCPIEIHFHHGHVCDKCHRGSQFWCLWRNCRGSLAESATFALQNVFARKLGLLAELVDYYIVPTGFTRDWLVYAGFPEKKVTVIAYPIIVPERTADPGQGGYVAFAGRVAPGKGLEILLKAVAKTGLPLQIAGDLPAGMVSTGQVTWRGFLPREELERFYRGARFLVVPSLWFETFALVAAEAMALGIPVIASRIGALAEVVEHGRTGLLFSPGDADELAEKMNWLWCHPDEGRRLGAAGREKVLSQYHENIYYAKLVKLYEMAVSGR